MALFGQATFFISLMFLVMTSAADLASDAKRYSELSRVFHTVGTVLALALWLIARSRRSLSVGALQAIDLAATTGICWSFAAMGHFALQPYGSYTGLLAITHVSVTRAMIVPSVPARTLGLGIACFGALVVSRVFVELPPD